GGGGGGGESARSDPEPRVPFKGRGGGGGGERSRSDHESPLPFKGRGGGGDGFTAPHDRSVAAMRRRMKGAASPPSALVMRPAASSRMREACSTCLGVNRSRGPDSASASLNCWPMPYTGTATDAVSGSRSP